MNIASKHYIVLCISEDRIRNEASIQKLMEDVTSYLITVYAKSMGDLPDFYRKFVYNETELYDDDYSTDEY